MKARIISGGAVISLLVGSMQIAVLGSSVESGEPDWWKAQSDVVVVLMGTTTLESRVALAETVRDRLQKTINRSRELMGQAEEADPALFQQAAPEPAVEEDRKSISPRRFPRQSHVSRYGLARPWTRHYARGPHRHKESVNA